MSGTYPARAGEPASGAAGRLCLCAVLFLIALNLRPALSSLSTLLEQIRYALGLSSTAAGVLTMAPTFCFGLSGGLALLLARHHGMERSIGLALACLVAGLLLRILPTVMAIFLGTILAGVGIGIAGVLLPGIIKRDFPRQLGLATGLYTMAMCGGGALAAALTVPLEHAFDTNWNATLGLWAAPAGLAAVGWLPYAARSAEPGRRRPTTGRTSLWRNGLAWNITGFMALQAALAFIVLGWLPVILRDRGFDGLTAGYVTSGSVLSQTVTALFIPMIATRMRSQRLLVAIALISSAIGFAGMTLGPHAHAAAWGVLLGLGQGANFGLALVFIGLRSRDAGAAAQLASMSQSAGYVLAAFGPMAAGIIRQESTAPTGQTVLFAAIAFLALVCGWVAGSDRKVGQSRREDAATTPAVAASAE